MKVVRNIGEGLRFTFAADFGILFEKKEWAGGGIK